ncbi:hypothetical protein Hamer_G020672, partial [Homarus americanus]
STTGHKEPFVSTLPSVKLFPPIDTVPTRPQRFSRGSSSLLPQTLRDVTLRSSATDGILRVKLVDLGRMEYKIVSWIFIPSIFTFNSYNEVRSLSPPQFIFWYHNNKMINYDQSRGGITVTMDHQDLTTSRLTISDKTAAIQRLGSGSQGLANATGATLVSLLLSLQLLLLCFTNLVVSTGT